MNRYAAFLCLLSIAAPAMGESAVYKCAGEDGEALYQDTPCPGARLPAAVVASPARRGQAGGAAAASEHGSAQETPPGLAVGMSDTKVLNMRGWGRPQKVTRTRARDGWREEWTYLSRPEEKRILQFVNGMLTAALSEPLLQEPGRLAAVEQ